MVVGANKHSQRHLVPIGYVGCVECDDVSEVSVLCAVARMAPEDIFHNIVIIHLYVVVELAVLHTTLLEESHQLVHIVYMISARIRSLPEIDSRMDGKK